MQKAVGRRGGPVQAGAAGGAGRGGWRGALGPPRRAGGGRGGGRWRCRWGRTVEAGASLPPRPGGPPVSIAERQGKGGQERASDPAAAGGGGAGGGGGGGAAPTKTPGRPRRIANRRS